MIWIVWRQHRLECLIVGIGLGVLGLFLLMNGIQMVQSSQQLGLGACLTQADHTRCTNLEAAFLNQFRFLNAISVGVALLPVLPGLLVGAPLVARELEQGTHRLIWTQSIPRVRWLRVKVVLILGATCLAFGILLALLIWWYHPAAQFTGVFESASFDISGPVLLASALLAVALGIFAGTLTRHVVLAMLMTLVLFLAIRFPVEFLLRPNYQPALTETWPLTQSSPHPPSDQDWVIATGWVDAHGNKTSRVYCPGTQTFELRSCLVADGFRTSYLTYQPADRFWRFQWIETGIYLVFATLALGAAFWLVKQRLT